ncbi:hypothetical protein VP01_2224g2 [Puccinia sorghi]|uniref:SNF2 N-terminal domain-containing protein n=1 Tax=Puccinia sorghi TaxID=27349 RepID=A0A0L6VAK8_9BASI|nr:hypothetical protein VP01_2224g2 [Puccinia sorghi]
MGLGKTLTTLILILTTTNGMPFQNKLKDIQNFISLFKIWLWNQDWIWRQQLIPGMSFATSMQ